MDIQIKDLLEAGVHFGHQKRRWNPKMKPYIYKEQNDIYIIDVRITLQRLKEAYDMLVSLASEGKRVIFVGTKKQAKNSVKEDAERCEMYYICERWLGGTFTNFRTIRNSVDKLIEYEDMEQDGRWDKLPKKEKLNISKSKKKLEKLMSGIRDMEKLPSCLIVFDTKKEDIAIKEAAKLGIPIIGLVDTNSDPDDVDIAIPANDDAIRSVKLFTKTFADAIIEGRSAFLKNKDFIDKKSKDKKETEKPKPGRTKTKAGTEKKDEKSSEKKESSSDSAEPEVDKKE